MFSRSQGTFTNPLLVLNILLLLLLLLPPLPPPFPLLYI
jgi:hypothetical protein